MSTDMDTALAADAECGPGEAEFVSSLLPRLTCENKWCNFAGMRPQCLAAKGSGCAVAVRGEACLHRQRCDVNSWNVLCIIWTLSFGEVTLKHLETP